MGWWQDCDINKIHLLKEILKPNFSSTITLGNLEKKSRSVSGTSHTATASVLKKYI